jgi:hypothetical protein
MPAGLLVTVPLPWPAKLTDSCTGGGPVNDAVTDVLAFRVTVQVPFPEHAPDQPLKVVRAAGAAVSTTVVPVVNDAPHVVPQLIPAGLLVTLPVPVPVSVTVSCAWEGPL